MDEPVALRPHRPGTAVRGASRVRTALVNMPWVSASSPSIQLGLLTAIGTRHGFAVDPVHANVQMAALIGLDRSDEIGETRRELLGEWLFAQEAFGDAAPSVDEEVFAAERVPVPDGETVESLLQLRSDVVPRFLDELLAERDWGRYDLVGFTSTFQQHVASLAFARRLKEAFPDVRIVFGGANVDGDMGIELLRAFPVVDLAVRGEADRAFPMLLEALSGSGDLSAVPGLLWRRGDEVVANRPDQIDDLDALPIPDFGEYFSRTAALDLLSSGHSDIELPVETARGCWWGEKVHCTFCGLNGQSMAYRSKSPDRAMSEILELSAAHDVTFFAPVDNILDRRYLDELFPRLIEQDLDLRFFYEVKADLSLEELEALRAAGVRRIQPGIESLDTHTLGLMGKGVRGATNVNLLRWCTHLGIEVGWNVLWGFPGERPDDVAAQARLCPDLVHLNPPLGGGRIWMERFSPLFRDGDFKWRRAAKGYDLSYPSHVDLDALAYFFDYELEGVLAEDEYQELGAAITRWRDVWTDGPQPSLTVVRGVDKLYVDDRRSEDRAGTYTLAGLHAEVHDEIMWRPKSRNELRSRFAEVPTEDLDAVLDRFVRHGLAMRDGNLYLALALPRSD